MTPRDLLDLAALDALGLLDEEGRAEFEAGFASASPEIQAAVRRAQLRATRIEDLLPQVEPPPGLKARVLSAMRTAIAAVALEAAAKEGPAVVGRINGKSSSMLRLLNSAFVWRAACLGFATATIVLGAFHNIIRQELVEVRDRMQTEVYATEFRDYFGPSFATAMMAPHSQWLSFVPAAADIDLGTSLDSVRAKLLYDPDTRVAFVRVEGLPTLNSTYHLVVEGADGSATRQLEFYGSHDAIFREIRNLEPDDLDDLTIYAPLPSGGGHAPVLRTMVSL
jgi:hypothetical protein